MAETLIKKFNQISKADTKIAGGKGASLGEMIQAGIPVPEGFVVLSHAFDRFLEETDLNVEINAVLDTVDIKEVHTVENASEKIQAMILSKEMPKNIKTEILKFYKKLDCKFVAVRSSATSEDSASAAWAGQLDSFLNTTEKTLLKNVKKCWASLFTPRAIFYRFEKKLNKDNISVAVVIQKMINSEKSGVAFSVHPITQDENQIIIEAGFGLGEAIVSGSITPDSYVIDKERLSIIDININKQTKALYKKIKGGNEWKKLGEKGKGQVLNEKSIIELSKLIVKIENHYGFPCDIEWAEERGEFYIVQSRPITTLSKFKRASARVEKFSIKWGIAAHDNNSPYFRNNIWVKGFTRYSELLNIPNPKFGILSANDQIEYLYDSENAWNKTFEELRKKIESDYRYFEKLIDTFLNLGEEMNLWTKLNIFDVDLTKLSNDALINLYRKFADYQQKMEVFGTTITLLDFGDFSFIEGNLRKILNKNVQDKDKIQKYFLILTEPSQNSFSQDQEEDLLRLIKKYGKEKFFSQISDKKIDQIKKLFPDFYADLVKHTEKYSWVYYVYKGPAFTEIEFVGFIKDYVYKKINPGKKLSELNKKKKIITERKEEIFKELDDVDNFSKFILKIAGKVVWAKPRKKDLQTKSYFHAEKLLREIANRLLITLDQVRSTPLENLEKALRGQKGCLRDSDSIKTLHVCLPDDDDSVQLLFGLEANKFREQINKSKKPMEQICVKELRGSTACVGKAKGEAKIINLPEDMIKMKHGDILVSAATTPSIIPAMKKAAAIITDEGGLTCHAAIVSREMNTPCVVGLKIATSVLQDGDLIEVDADSGMVRVVKNNGK